MAKFDSIESLDRYMVVPYALATAAMFAALHPFDNNFRSPLSFVSFLAVMAVFGLWSDCAGRIFRDAGLPRWSASIYTFGSFLGCITLLDQKILDGPKTFALFALLQVPLALIPGKPAPDGPSPLERSQGEKSYLSKSVKKLLAGRFTLLLIVLLLAVSWALSPSLGRSSGHGQWTWVLALGFPILLLAWLTSFFSRSKDAGVSSGRSLAYLVILVFSFGLPIHFKSISHAIASSLFVLLQIPLVFMRSKRSAEALPDSTDKKDAGRSRNSEFEGPVGRFTFLLRVLLVAACLAAFFQLWQRADSELAMWELGLFSLLFGLIWVLDASGRLMDAGMPRSFSNHCEAIIALMSFLPFAFKLLTVPQALALFVLLQIPMVFLQSKPEDATVLEWRDRHEETMIKRAVRRTGRTRRLSHNNRVSFTVSVFLVVFFLGVLNTLSANTNFEIELLALDLLSCFLFFIWFIFLGMRLGEAGLSHWHKNTFLLVVAACSLPYAYKFTDFPQTLALFVVLQIPFFFARKKPASTGAAPEAASPGPVMDGAGPEAAMDGEMLADEETASRLQDKDRPKSRPIGPVGFLYALVAIACLWLVLIRLNEASGHGLGVWIARVGYAVLGFLWLGFAILRFKDAGLFGRGHFGPYWIAVSGASLLPLMLGFTNGYESLAIFVVIQIPTVFLRSKPAPEEPLQVSADSVEEHDAFHDFAERKLVESTNESGLAYQRRKSAIYTGAGLGRAKRVPRWRRF